MFALEDRCAHRQVPLHLGVVLHVPGRIVRVNALLAHVANQVGVDPTLVKAVAWMESGWQQGVVSPTGAVGMMQVEPYTGEWISRYLAGRPLDLHVAAEEEGWILLVGTRSGARLMA